MKKIMFISILATFTVLLPLIAVADTSDQRWMTKVEVKKRGAHCINDSNCFNRYHPNIPAVAKANPGDIGKHSQSQRNYEQNLAEMTPAELSAIIDRWEGEKAAIVKDITPF